MVCILLLRQLREKLADLMNEGLESADFDDEAKTAFREWLDNFNDGVGSKTASNKILKVLDNPKVGYNNIAKEILERKDYLVKKSQWIIGGDGWSYDIGFGGLDHVLASGDDINIFVMDTEIYSNTGGQASKSSNCQVAKSCWQEKELERKIRTYGYELAIMFMYSMGANMNQTIKVLAEGKDIRVHH